MSTDSSCPRIAIKLLDKPQDIIDNLEDSISCSIVLQELLYTYQINPPLYHRYSTYSIIAKAKLTMFYIGQNCFGLARN